jgi:hypothetical protein
MEPWWRRLAPVRAVAPLIIIIIIIIKFPATCNVNVTDAWSCEAALWLPMMKPWPIVLQSLSAAAWTDRVPRVAQRTTCAAVCQQPCVLSVCQSRRSAGIAAVCLWRRIVCATSSSSMKYLILHPSVVAWEWIPLQLLCALQNAHFKSPSHTHTHTHPPFVF